LNKKTKILGFLNEEVRKKILVNIFFCLFLVSINLFSSNKLFYYSDKSNYITKNNGDTYAPILLNHDCNYHDLIIIYNL